MAKKYGLKSLELKGGGRGGRPVRERSRGSLRSPAGSGRAAEPSRRGGPRPSRAAPPGRPPGTRALRARPERTVMDEGGGGGERGPRRGRARPPALPPALGRALPRRGGRPRARGFVCPERRLPPPPRYSPAAGRLNGAAAAHMVTTAAESLCLNGGESSGFKTFQSG